MPAKLDRSLDFGYPNTSLDAATGTGAGTSFAVVPRGNNAPRTFAWDIIRSGTVSTLQVDIQGSLDGTNWFQLDTYNTPGADTLRFIVDKPVYAIRANLVILTGGGNITTRLWGA